MQHYLKHFLSVLQNVPKSMYNINIYFILAQTPVATAPSISPAEPIVVAPTGKYTDTFF